VSFGKNCRFRKNWRDRERERERERERDREREIYVLYYRGDVDIILARLH
jgi:hypothetical protein